ncbi:hypothetical protein APHAL10511_000584 [Amanita phalloides]|nr:hypothetical protein APHAL10511_000584 [Amanita phalloides]
MANIIRSAKSGSDWGGNELMAYNITVIAKPPPLTGLDPALVTASLDADDVSDDTYRFLTYLDLATNAGQETAIDDFAREVLRTLGFEERGLALRIRHNIPLAICGDIGKVAQTDVCLLDRRSMVLLVLQRTNRFSTLQTLKHKSHRSLPIQQPEAATHRSAPT